MKRLRKEINVSGSNIKYYACGEYGSQTKRPHYHAIMFNLPQEYINNADHIYKTWSKGHIVIAPCNTATIRYVTKYLLKPKSKKFKDELEVQPEFSLMSKGLGKNYLTPQMKEYHRTNLLSHVTLPGGALTSLPRYYRDKIFDDDMKVILNQEAELFRNYNFDKLFNSNSLNKYKWKLDQRRKQEKVSKTERVTV